MQLNNDSLPTTSLRGLTRFETNTTTTEYSNADLDGILNRYYHYIVAKITNIGLKGWDLSGTTDNTIDLVANQQNYTLPTTLIRIRRIDISYDGTNWVRAEKLEPGTISHNLNPADLTDYFSKDTPFYSLDEQDVIKFYPRPDAAVTDGVRIWATQDVTELSADADEPITAEWTHPWISYGAAREFFSKFKLPDERRMTERMFELEREVQEFYGTRQEDSVDRITMITTHEDYK